MAKGEQEQEGSLSPENKLPHPFAKVLVQFDVLLKMIEENRHKTVKVPRWALMELTRLQQELEKLKTLADRHFPLFGEYSDEILQTLLRTLPEERRTAEIDIIENIQALKSKTEEARKRFNLTPPSSPEKTKKKERSPLILLDKKKVGADSEKDKEDEIERRRKFGRIGGRKNWRPL